MWKREPNWENAPMSSFSGQACWVYVGLMIVIGSLVHCRLMLAAELDSVSFSLVIFFHKEMKRV